MSEPAAPSPADPPLHGAWAALPGVAGRAVAFSLLSATYIGGTIGAGTVAVVGPALAMGGWMLRADVPVEPKLGYPWLTTVALGLLPLPWLRRRAWTRASLASVPFALLPIVQLVRLYLAARPRTWE